MSIRFKFRSAVNFDSMEVGDRASISVRELRAKILGGKVSQPQQQGFDLVFYDAVSGLEYKGDDFQIPRGSSVIVRRVPCGTVPAALSPIEAVTNVGMKSSYTLNPVKEPFDEFDDFGADLFPSINANLPQSVQEVDKNNVRNKDTEDSDGLRLDRQKLDTTNLSKAILRGTDRNGTERNILLEARVEEQRQRSNNLPLELKCPLCKYYLKEAVMIPCCQHSFCENCIRRVLIEKGRCPQCCSGECGVGSLLPNLSVRNAIRHFLEYQVLNTGSQNHDLKKHVPERESGIRAEGIAYSLTVVERQPEVPQSSCATGKGSNHIFELCYKQQPQRNEPLAAYGEDIHFSAHSGRSKGIRTCFTCGSPDHLMRDCPTSNLTPMFQPGNGAFNAGMQTYGAPYWSYSTFPPFGSYLNMYSNLGLMPFNPSMAPVPPFTMPPYISPMCGGSFVPGGDLRMGNMGQPSNPEFCGLQRCENRKNLLNKNLPRGQFFGNEEFSNRRKSPDRAHDCLSRESFTRRSRKRSRHDK